LQDIVPVNLPKRAQALTQIRVSDSTWKQLSKDNDSSLATVLLQSIPNSTNLSSDAVTDIKVAMLGYIMHVNDFNDLKRVVRYWDLETNDSYKLLHGILENFETNLGLKQALLICLNKMRDKERINYTSLMRTCDITAGNEVWLTALKGINFKGNLLTKVKERPLLIPKQVKRNCQETMKNLEQYVTRFVYHSLHFVVKYNQMDHKDMISDLMRKGVETYYRVTPMQVDLHRENSVKRSIHNQGMKEISFFTSKKRARIVKTGEGEYETKEQSLHNKEGFINDSKMGDANWQLPTLRFETERVMQQYIEANRKQAHIVLKLMFKDNDAYFEKYVRTKMRASEDHSIENLAASRPKNYTKFIADYHDIPELTVRRIAYELLRAFNGEQTTS
jgi:hypothetical protein